MRMNSGMKLSVLVVCLVPVYSWNPFLVRPYAPGNLQHRYPQAIHRYPFACRPKICGHNPSQTPHDVRQQLRMSTSEKREVFLYDSTLSQRNAEWNTEDKLKLADMLSTFGMNFIEGGWPSVNLVDEAFFKRARQELSPSCFQKLVAMAPVVEGVSEEEERRRAKDLLALNVRNLGLAATVLGADGNWVTKESVARLASHIRHVREWEKTTEGRLNIFVHLHNGFDAWRQDKLRLFNIISELQEAGADGLLIVDNGGIGTPWEIAELARELVQRKQARKETTWLGISCSDHLELAAASALYAAKEGMELVTGTVNGLEGTTDLTTVIPVLQLKMKLGLVESQALRSLTRLSRTVNEQMNLPHRSNQPFVGNSAFAHKGGIHVAAVLKNEDSYQHIDPTLVGNQRRVLISELSGRGNIMSKVEEFGMLGQQGGALKTGEKQGKDEEWKQRSGEILKSVKELERKGYTFEGAEASVDLMIRRSLPEYRPAFSVVEYQVYNYDIEPTMERVKRWRSGAAGDYFSKERKTAKCKAVVAVRVDQSVQCIRREDNCEIIDEEERDVILEVSPGNGPVDALAKALNRALLPSFPSLASVELCDYKVRILDADKATSANVRVMIEFQLTGHEAQTATRTLRRKTDDKDDNEESSFPKRITWTTVSAGPNIISASFAALVDGYEYHLAEHLPKMEG